MLLVNPIKSQLDSTAEVKAVTQIIHTPERIIVKIPDCIDVQRAVKRAEKKLGVELQQFTYTVSPVLIFSDSWNAKRRERQARRSRPLSDLARKLQSRASRHARSFIPQIDQPGAWSKACETSHRARLCARYALNPHACMVPVVTPQLP